MQNLAWFVTFTGICFGLLAVVRAIRLVPDAVSAFELKKRLAAKDDEARYIQERRLVLSRLVSLQRLCEVLLVVLIGTSFVMRSGWWVGVFFAVLVVLLADILSSLSHVRRTLQPFYERYEPDFVPVIASWRWLDVFRSSIAPPNDLIVSSKDELIDLIDRSGSVLSDDEQKHLRQTLAFDDALVKDIMTPRSMIDSISKTEIIGPVTLDQLHKTGHSRFPVVDGDIDHVVGMLYMHDLIKLDTRRNKVGDAMHPEVYYIHENQQLEHALHAFLRTRHHLCIVVNEFRETVGILSLEDVIEALLGRQVVDEFDEFEDLRKVAQSNPRANNQPRGRKDV